MRRRPGPPPTCMNSLGARRSLGAPGPRTRGDPWADPAAITCGCDASGLGVLRYGRRLRLAKVRPRPKTDNALRHDVARRGGSSGAGARLVEGGAVAAPVLRRRWLALEPVGGPTVPGVDRSGRCRLSRSVQSVARQGGQVNSPEQHLWKLHPSRAASYMQGSANTFLT